MKHKVRYTSLDNLLKYSLILLDELETIEEDINKSYKKELSEAKEGEVIVLNSVTINKLNSKIELINYRKNLLETRLKTIEKVNILSIRICLIFLIILLISILLVFFYRIYTFGIVIFLISSISFFLYDLILIHKYRLNDYPDNFLIIE